MAKISTLLICFSLLCLLVGSSLANPAPIPFDDLELPELDKRQDNNSTSTSSEVASTSTRSSTSRTTSIVTPSMTTTTTSSRTTPTTPTTSSTPTTTTTTPPPGTTVTTPTSTSTTPRPPAETTSTEPAPSTTQSEDVVTASPTTRVVVATIYTTLSSNGQVSSYVTSSTTVETPTGTALPAGNNNNSGSGLSTSTRNTIIGVVVGVGGALMFGGLAIVAWRLKRKRVNPVDEDDLMRRDGSPLAAGRDMHPASPEASPFKATLDQYHKPPGVVNTSSNF